MSIDITASKFLDNYLKLQKQPETTAPKVEHNIFELVGYYDNVQVENVILTRTKEPRFFAGQKRNGELVWAHDMKFARPVSENLVPMYEEKMGETLLPIWPYSR